MKTTKRTHRKTLVRNGAFELHAKAGKLELLKDIEIGFFCIYNGKVFTYYPDADQARISYNTLTR